MKKITVETKKNIIDIILNGFQIKKNESFFPDEEPSEFIHEIKMPYNGKMAEQEFISRLYDLKSMPSNDSRYKNAEADYYQHRIYNNDWPDNWIFNDGRFGLRNGDDKIFLKFLCEMFHPSVRDENTDWKQLFDIFNDLIKADGYEFFEINKILDKIVYGYRLVDSIEIASPKLEKYSYTLKLIGSGSYATVSKYFDEYYKETFVLKKALNTLNEKELARFEKEFNEMKKLNMIHVVKVYSISDDKKSYIMEYMDMTLLKYINENNSKIEKKHRLALINQLFNLFITLSGKKILHRDISLTNILLKKYDDNLVLKISDFGLVKVEGSTLTSIDTEVKGSLNDPQLNVYGFKNYEIRHETYALTRVIYFIMTGKTKIGKENDIKFNDFIEKGINRDIEKRFTTFEVMKKEFFEIFGK